jgi:hypothetical protein
VTDVGGFIIRVVRRMLRPGSIIFGMRGQTQVSRNPFLFLDMKSVMKVMDI